MYSRREFGKLTLAALALPRTLTAAVDSKVKGVRFGVQTYSFRDLPRPEGGDAVDVIIQAMTACGLGECELWSPQLEPAKKTREELRAWRLTTPLDHFAGIRQKFDAAGLEIFGYNYSFNPSFTDEEIDRGFEMARALGAEIITASTTLPVAKRVVPFAEKHKMIVAMHGHSKVDDPSEFATPESFAAALKMSRYFKVNLDIGHFTAGNFDAVAYVREHHADITNLHIKDRKKNQGENTPWGEGDTPIREVLQLVEKNKWPIPADIEYEYRGTGTPVEEVKKCYAYARQALA
ncbi:MAG: sugar phosphate isomerase/epimerase [Acidobacteria bacterium]|nr:MAG: sugar phosphate isomerase/epimerase [Acidobacteriota bacterium]